MPRRFEFVGGSSAKFYEVDVAGSQVNIRYGRIGTSGQTLTKSLKDRASAQKEADKLVAQKTAKGYVECAVC